jgi:hypothetical protein
MATVEWLRPDAEFREDTGESPELSYVKTEIAGFMKQHEELGDSLQRAPLAIELVERLRMEIRAEAGSTTLEPTALLDTIDWQAWNELWFYSGKDRVDIPGQLEEQEIKNEESAAKNRLYDDISGYDHTAEDAGEAHRALLTDFHLARLVIKNPLDPVMAASESLDHIALAQMLSAHKLVKALKSAGFSRARLSTLEERDKKIGAIVPIGKTGKSAVPIQLQPASKRAPALTTAVYNKRLLVNMTYYPEPENYFTMPETDKVALREAIKDYRGRLLGLVPGVVTVSAEPQEARD